MSIGSLPSALGSPSSQATPQTPFTVADSIGMQRLIDPDASDVTLFRPKFKFSPDGSKFAVVTMRGRLSDGKNEYALALLNTEAVLTFLRSDRHVLPSLDIIARMEASRYQYSIDHAIDGARWADNRTLLFIGRDDDGIRQVFAVDIKMHQVRQLTQHPYNVGMFDASLRSGVIAYAARTPPDWTERNEHGYVITSDWMQDLGRDDPQDATQEIHYFVARLADHKVVHVNSSPGIVPRVLSLSPNGRWLVIFDQATGLHPEWLQYSAVADANRASAALAAKTGDDAAGDVSPWLGQFLIVDTATGETKPLVRAPAMLDVVVEALWSSDSRSVVLSRSYLPLDVADDSERRRRSGAQSIVEVDVASGTVARVADDTQLWGQSGRGHITALERNDDHVVLWSRVSGATGEQGRHFQKVANAWAERPLQHKSDERLYLSVAQDLNTSPDIQATDAQSGRSGLITHLNPLFRERTLGRAEEFRWHDKSGNLFAGALVFPPVYRNGLKYPLVLQTSTGSFTPKEFLLDGLNGATSAFAARALANKDILVLQMPSPGSLAAEGPVESWWREGEAPRFTAMMEGAIEALADKGLIDRARVGLIGFSRTGMHVSHALVFSKYPIAAATIADGMAATPFGQAIFYGIPYPSGMYEFERPTFIGAPLWGGGISNWIERSPLFHLERLTTPLRIETYGLGVPAYWDIFAILKRQMRPVELVHIPHAHHVLVTPYARYTSQQGNVDWFAYWLRGERDNTAENLQQYARWDKLRAQRDRAGAKAAGE